MSYSQNFLLRDFGWGNRKRDKWNSLYIFESGCINLFIMGILNTRISVLLNFVIYEYFVFSRNSYFTCYWNCVLIHHTLQISGPLLDESQVKSIVDEIKHVITASSSKKRESWESKNCRFDAEEGELLKEENEQEQEVFDQVSLLRLYLWFAFIQLITENICRFLLCRLVKFWEHWSKHSKHLSCLCLRTIVILDAYVGKFNSYITLRIHVFFPFFSCWKRWDIQHENSISICYPHYNRIMVVFLAGQG